MLSYFNVTKEKCYERTHYTLLRFLPNLSSKFEEYLSQSYLNYTPLKNIKHSFYLSWVFVFLLHYHISCWHLQKDIKKKTPFRTIPFNHGHLKLLSKMHGNIVTEAQKLWTLASEILSNQFHFLKSTTKI